jgi:catechol 2,3-dioxygenase-like lactoylglutathione lyase family enzyme
MPLDHVSLQAASLAAAATFYDAALAPLGIVRIAEFGDTIGYGEERPYFWIGAQSSDAPQKEVHVAFRASARAAVQQFFDAAVAAGAEVLHEPCVFPEYHPNYYGAFVRDPDGNNVEAVCHSSGG